MFAIFLFETMFEIETFIDVCFGLCLNKAPFQRFSQADRNLTLLGSANVAGDFFSHIIYSSRGTAIICYSINFVIWEKMCQNVS